MVDDTFFSVTLPTLEDLSCLCYQRMMIKSCLFLWKKTVSSTQRHTMCIVLDSGETELRKWITSEYLIRSMRLLTLLRRNLMLPYRHGHS